MDTKTLLVVPDGMADWEQPSLGDKTPLEVAKTPNLDRLTRQGRLHRLHNIPKGCPADSAIANLALLGYDPREYHLGRGPLEALNLGIKFKDGEVAFRCNLVNVNEHDVLVDYSAGNLRTDIARDLFEDLNKEFGRDGFRFYPGVRYRGVLVVEGMGDVVCQPPHDEMGEKIQDIFPSGEGSDRLQQMMVESRDLLENHPINMRFKEKGETIANMAWPWGNGVVRDLPSIEDRYGLSGSVVAGVDLINGLSLAVGFEKREVEGATGDYDTDMEAKGKAAVEELENHDLVFVHLEAIDEAGHDGDAELKVEMIERWDRELLKPIVAEYERRDMRIALGPDHYTPIQKRTHIDDPVPFLIVDGDANDDHRFRESDAEQAPFVEEGWQALAQWYKNDLDNPFQP
ncbi:MAG: cofactor-independent phosphoglycerate mutase [bacterium]